MAYFKAWQDEIFAKHERFSLYFHLSAVSFYHLYRGQPLEASRQTDSFSIPYSDTSLFSLPFRFLESILRR